MNIYGWIVGLIIGGGIGYTVGKSDGKTEGVAEQNKETIIEKQHKEKAENLNKIHMYVRGKSEITNNEIERHFNFSNATTERYLDELEKSGHLKQVGATGAHVTYKVLS